MEPLKHECGIALIRLRKPLSYYQENYGTSAYGLQKLYLLMEKQHNRGQEGAGIALQKIDPLAGNEYIFRERALGSGAIQEVFQAVDTNNEAELYLGHLRYSTTGRHGIAYTQPLLRRNNFLSRTLVLAGNFNLTNVDEVFNRLVEQGQHPRMYSDTYLMLESMGYYLDMHTAGGEKADIPQVLRSASDNWDGGYAVCGTTGDGNAFCFRDPHGIRPAFYYIDDEVVVVASERPVIQTVFDAPQEKIPELELGMAILISKDAEVSFASIHPAETKKSCSFERIYFSRGSDADIYKERKELGRLLVPSILQTVDFDIDNTVLSFIPNTAETAFYGMMEGFDSYLNEIKARMILEQGDRLFPAVVQEILNRRVRVEKVAVKDIKLRTFIAQENSRNDLAAHVYDVTYGIVRAEKDNLVVIDDSIVRGTTLKQSIIKMLDRLRPKHIVIVSSCPQVRYPDCYGIDMSMLSEFAAFRATVELLKERGMEHIIEEVYQLCLESINRPTEVNHVKRLYAPFTDEEIAERMAQMFTPYGTKARVSIVFQTVEGLRRACPNHTGDWYFTGDYPTIGGNRVVNRAFVNWVEGHEQR